MCDFFVTTKHYSVKEQTFLQELDNFNPDLKFTDESNKKEILVLDLKVKLNVKSPKISIFNLRTGINIYILHYHIVIILIGQQYADRVIS